MKIFDDIKNLIAEFRTRMAELAQEEQNLRRTIARQAETLDDQRTTISQLLADKTSIEKRVDVLTAEASTLRAQLDHAALQLGGRLESGLASTATPGERIRQALADIGRSEGSIEMPGLSKQEKRISPSPDGREAEELRRGIEQLLNKEDNRLGFVDDPDAKKDLRRLMRGMQFLLDEVDARDSLAYLDHVEEKLQNHVRTLLGILDATGGFMPTDYQAAIRAAREVVAG